jgi:CDK inhibitor PHO81
VLAVDFWRSHHFTLRFFKFGKYIQSQQIPGWAPYYLDYKFLKKIISSFVANRPASEAATLALGIRPSDLLSASNSAPLSNQESQDDPDQPPLYSPSIQDEDRAYGFSAHKAAFFFKLERELEKVRTKVDGPRPYLTLIDQRVLLAKRS